RCCSLRSGAGERGKPPSFAGRMTFKVDENLPAQTAVELRGQGYEAETVVEEGLRGAVDPIVLETVRDEGCALLTMGKGIADVRANPPDRYAGLVLFQPRSSGRAVVLAFVRRNLPAVLQINLAGRLIVVAERGIRMR